MLPYAIGNVFTKAGSYIFSLGMVSFLEILSTNLLCFIYCYFLEMQRSQEAKEKLEELSLLEQNQFNVLVVAGVLGNLIFSAYVTAISLAYPFMPVALQSINTVLWLLNVMTWFVQDIRLLFIWMMFIGGLSGASFTNFLFLANAKTDLFCDLGLNIYERELVVNLMLMSDDLGQFYGYFFGLVTMYILVPDIIFTPPG